MLPAYGLHSEAMEIQDLTLFESGDPSRWSGNREKGTKTAENREISQHLSHYRSISINLYLLESLSLWILVYHS